MCATHAIAKHFVKAESLNCACRLSWILHASTCWN